MTFPKDFIWGVASSSYQIEGGAHADGRGLSIWDQFSKWPGKVYGGNTGDVSTDHYHRYADDVALMADFKVQAYRFSVSWPRVLPNGTGEVNAAGLGFYDRLVDTLLQYNIQPWLNIFHWDYPYELYCKGGWLNPSSPDWFAEYTGVLVDRLSDRVSHWMTINEPQVFIETAYHLGEHAPGLKLDIPDLLRMTHNTLLAHGKSVQVIRARARTAPKVMAAPVGITAFPDSHDPIDVEAARQTTFRVDGHHLWNNSWYMDPMFLGNYPDDGLRAYGKHVPSFPANDMETIHQPLDFFGFNNYHGDRVRMDDEGKVEFVKGPDGPPLTTMGWRVTPEALYWGPKFFYERYQLPILITENGMAGTDWVHLDGKVHDPARIDFMHRYLQQYKRASQDGVDCRGYFAWTFLDNFEWGFGYSQRFGLIYTDFKTLQRTPKDSAYWYRQVIETNGVEI